MDANPGSALGANQQALINLTLRACRLADRSGAGHSRIWERFKPYFDAELRDRANGRFEFSTLVANYLPNFLYMSREWVTEKLPQIFDSDHYDLWRCAMQGYSYVRQVYPDVYEFLKVHGDFVRALDDPSLKSKVADKVIQNIVIAYVNDFETLDKSESLLAYLLNRAKPNEMSQLAWFVWTLRKEGDAELTSKVLRLWDAIHERVDVSTKQGRLVASYLCKWSVFVERLDDHSMALLAKVAPYSNEDHNSSELLRSLARLSESDPLRANELWMLMLQGSLPDYPTEAITQILRNLWGHGDVGRAAARLSVSEYLKKGSERPAASLRELAGSEVERE
ncbi:MAG: hypothetical protein U1F39_00910 [Steroidobacteraceae bacterium]